MISATDILHAKILIVDDQEVNVALLEQMLLGEGYDCLASTMDPSKVCELHLVNCYDLILLDLQMPEMDGFQVMENLEKIETSGYLPVLVITAQPSHKLRALRSGAKDFLSKPLDLAEVLLRVHNMLEVRLLHLETKKLYERVVAEHQLAERRLLGMLPQAIAERMRKRPEVTAGGTAGLVTESYAELTLLFADLVEFTSFAEGASAEVLLGVLQDISARVGGSATDRSLARSKTISGGYLAAIGLSDAVANRTIGAAQLGLDLAEAMDRFNEHGRYKLKVRIGLESNRGVAGSVRKRKIHCDL